MIDSSCVLPLPTSLVLLLHLHILSYPQCNSAEYSSVTLFAHSRPLRDRTKTMEDIVAFLIEKIEGKEKRKSILGGTYPCLQPSDTVAFRVNVTKYLEALRTTVTRPSLQGPTSQRRIPAGKASSPNSQLGSTGKSPCPSPQENSSPVAWWWSAIVVRKSLLEECSGDRFEKLLLALSTHALFVQVPFSSPLHSLNTTPSEVTSGLRIQSREYANLLSRSFELHTGRAQSVSRLNTRTNELISLRARLSLAPEATERVHAERLFAMRDAKRQDLLEAWQDGSLRTIEHLVTASDALMWIASIAGIITDDSQREEPTSAEASTPNTPDSDSAAVQTLPTASAHHPTNMHKLRSLPSFISLHPDLPVDGFTGVSDAGSSFNSPALEELLHDASVQNTALKAALESAVTAGNDIAQKLDLALKAASGTQGGHVDIVPRQLDLWSPVNENTVSDAQEPGILEFLSALDVSPSLPDIHIQQRMEASVLAVRESLQPGVPSSFISDADLSHSPELPQHATPLATTEHYSSVMPLGSAPSYGQFGMPTTESSRMVPMTPEKKTPRPYETSTPPPKSHPRTARAVRVAGASDTGGVLLTPTDNREYSAAGSATGKRSLPRELIADMSLPAFSDGDMTHLAIVSPQEFEATDREWCQEYGPDPEEGDVPYEGHSVTLRDILLRAGRGEDSFHLIDDLEDLDDGLENETIGWG
ncbi:hypothetical protein JB92DRAFT_2881529 [Gautieria morchelliformis]|nr:hypothetical protein JB92DRAFT_2881529 [Gautieria morchelliformis]